MKQEQRILGIVIFGFLIVLVWTAVHFYDNYTQSTVSETLTTQIAPISPAFDKDTLHMLEKRINQQPLYTVSDTSSSTTSAQQSIQTPLFLPTPVSSPGGLLK